MEPLAWDAMKIAMRTVEGPMICVIPLMGDVLMDVMLATQGTFVINVRSIKVLKTG